MFARKIRVDCLHPDGPGVPCPVAWIDNFAMRNFTNDAIFDDTLPTGDGAMEIGLRVPLDQLQVKMEDWFRRKGYLKVGDVLVLVEGQGLHNDGS
jgi:hypothetical protein